jgi:hypothetical protein
MKMKLTLSFIFSGNSSQFVRHGYDEHHNALMMCAAPKASSRPSEKEGGRQLAFVCCRPICVCLTWARDARRRAGSRHSACTCAGHVSDLCAVGRTCARDATCCRHDYVSAHQQRAIPTATSNGGIPMPATAGMGPPHRLSVGLGMLVAGAATNRLQQCITCTCKGSSSRLMCLILPMTIVDVVSKKAEAVSFSF